MASVPTRQYSDVHDPSGVGVAGRPASDSSRIRRFVQPDQVFSELDGEPISAGMVHGTIEVYGVRDEAGSRWVQLSVNGQTSQMVTLRLPVGESARRAFAVLSSELQAPSRGFAAVSNCPMYVNEAPAPGRAH